MAKLQRITGKVFGETASAVGDANVGPYIGQFGSAKLGTYYGTTDVSEIQNLSAWSNGFIDAVTPSNQYPTLPEMTGVCKNLSYQECYILQQGIPEYDANTEYYTNGFCSYGNEIYISLQDSNTGNQPDTSPTYWAKYSGRFLNYKQITNCVLEAPNGVYSKSGRTVTIKEGLKVLIPNGLNADKTLNNIELTVSNDIAQTLSYGTGQVRTCFLAAGGTTAYVGRANILGYYKSTSYFPTTVDSASTTYYAFGRIDNFWYTTSGSTTANWTVTNIVPIFTVYLSSDNDCSILNTNYAVRLVDTDMVDGNWVYKVSSLNTSTGYTTYDIDLSSVLPRDDYFYECLFTFMISRTDNTVVNSYYNAIINGTTVAQGFLNGGMSSTDQVLDYGQYTGIIDNSRSMQIQLSASQSAVHIETHSTKLVAYRRLGRNA